MVHRCSGYRPEGRLLSRLRPGPKFEFFLTVCNKSALFSQTLTVWPRPRTVKKRYSEPAYVHASSAWFYFLAELSRLNARPPIGENTVTMKVQFCRTFIKPFLTTTVRPLLFRSALEHPWLLLFPWCDSAACHSSKFGSKVVLPSGTRVS